MTVNLSFSASAATIIIPEDSSSSTITPTAIDNLLYEADKLVVLDIDTVNNGIENRTQ
jgi:hypothetical protein